MTSKKYSFYMTKLAVLILSSFVFSFDLKAQPTNHDEQHHHHHNHGELPTSAPVTGKSVYNVSGKWLNATGESSTLQKLAGKPQLAAMVFTSCKTACPMIVEDLKKLHSTLTPEAQKKVGITIFSIDHERDTPAQLAGFAKRRKLDANTWTLLTGATPDSVSELAAVLGVRYKKIKDDFVHSNVVFLLNKQGEIVATKEGLATKSETFEKEIAKIAK